MAKRKVEIIDCDFCDAQDIKPVTKFEFSSGPETLHVTAHVTFTGFDYSMDVNGKPEITYDICPQCALLSLKRAYKALEDRQP